MLPCTKVDWKITCVSSGEFLGPMQEMGMKFKHLGIVVRPGTLRSLVLKFLSIQNTPENHKTWHGVMSWYYHVVVKKLQNRNKFWYKFLANRSFSQEGSWFWEGTCHLCVHNSNFKYKHMLQCTKAGWKITCVSSGKFLGPMPEMGMKFKHLGVMARLETLRNLVF